MTRSNRKLKNGGYPPEWTEIFKRSIRQRDNYLCAICQGGGRMDVHHIDYTKLHTTRDNCISLCRTCHDRVHDSSWAEKQDWKLKLWRIAAERERKYRAVNSGTRQALRTRP